MNMIFLELPFHQKLLFTEKNIFITNRKVIASFYIEPRVKGEGNLSFYPDRFLFRENWSN